MAKHFVIFIALTLVEVQGVFEKKWSMSLYGIVAGVWQRVWDVAWDWLQTMGVDFVGFMMKLLWRDMILADANLRHPEMPNAGLGPFTEDIAVIIETGTLFEEDVRYHFDY